MTHEEKMKKVDEEVILDLPEGDFLVEGYKRLPGNIIVFSGQLGEIRAEIHALVDGDDGDMDDEDLFTAGWQEYDIY